MRNLVAVILLLVGALVIWQGGKAILDPSAVIITREE